MDTSTFTFIFQNITGVSYDYADATWFCLSDKDKCRPARAAFEQGREFIRRNKMYRIA